MPSTYTPLRYPGGKTKLYDFVKRILQSNNILGHVYCEPFAGGAGLALKLLLKNDVSRIIINDADPAIYAFWNSVLNRPEELCRFIDGVAIGVDEWEHQRAIYFNVGDGVEIDLACATLFLNRTNVSGVITGGVIGGKNQTGKYKMDARFNREDLKRKIRTIAMQRDRIELYNLDVLDFMNTILAERKDDIFVNFDPPYVNKGGQLYKNSFTSDDHRVLRNHIRNFNKKWIVTYDVCDLIEELYTEFRGGKISIYYSANDVRKAEEFVFYSNDLIIPE